MSERATNQINTTPDTKGRRLCGSIFDHRSLAAFRIGMGITLLLNLYLRACDGRLTAFFTDAGVLPVAHLSAPYRWSILDSFSSPSSVRFAFALIACVYVAHMVGFLTRYTKWLVVLCLLSLYHRNPLIDEAPDYALRLVAIWTALLPLGRSWSLDRAIFTRSRWLTEPDCFVGALGFSFNLSSCYLLNALQKDGIAWHSGEAIGRILWDVLATPLGVSMRGGWLCTASIQLSLCTLLIEWALAGLIICSLLLKSAKRMVVVLMIALHGAFGLFLYLGTFVPLFIAVALLFIPSEDWDRVSDPAELNFNKSWTTEALALAMSIWCCASILLHNPSGAGVLSRAVATVYPRVFQQLDAFTMVAQEWFLFRSPPDQLQPLLVSARKRDGTEIDPIRHTPFNTQAPFVEASKAGQFWVAYLVRLARNPAGPGRRQFTEYLFNQGFDDVEIFKGSMKLPEQCGGAPGQVELIPLFRAQRPMVFELSSANVTTGLSSSVNIVTQRMEQYGNYWAQHTQIFADLARATPRELMVRFNAEQSCMAQWTLAATVAPDFGRFDVNVNGGSAVPVDLYSPFGVSFARIPIGSSRLEQGENTLKITLQGDNNTTKTKIGVDQVIVQCVD